MERWENLIEELRAEFLLREEELRLLHEIDRQLLSSERPLGATFDFIVQRTQELIKADHTHILLRRGRFLEGAHSTKSSDLGQRIEISHSLVGESLALDRSVRISDLNAEDYRDRYVPIKGYTGEPMRSLLAVPIKVHDTKVGVLNAESTTVDAFTSVHETFMTAIAAQVAIALQRAQLFDRNALFSDVDQLIFASADSPNVIQSALERVMQALRDLEHIELSEALICFRRGKDLEIVHSTKPSDVGLVLGIDESICGRAVRERKTIVLGDVSAEPEYRRLFGSSIQSEIAVPILLGGDDIAIGVLNVESEEVDAFQGFSQVILESFAEKVRVLLAYAKLRSDVTDAMDFRNASDLLIAVGDQTSNMIHRMNNTVGAMRVQIMDLQQNLREEGGLPQGESMAESLEGLRKLAERTLQMPQEVTQLLSQQSSTVDVNAAVGAALEKIQVPSDVSVRLDLCHDLPLLSLYCFDIVVQNLLQNAIDAMPDGGSLSVTTSTVVQAQLPIGYVQLIVQDTGTGIPEDILPKIFDLNFTTKRTSTKGRGLGLGLWWIRNFVRRANGDIAVVGAIGEGSTFTVKIPFERPPAEVRTFNR
jgi:signal transduction histidine kinase